MSYARLPQRRLAGLGGEAWVLPNPLTKPNQCLYAPIDLQVMIHPGENTWIVSNKSHAPMQAGPSSTALLSERIRAMLNFSGITVQSITFSEGAYNSVLTAGGAKYSGPLTTDCALCTKPIYATVKFTYASSGPLFVIWPVWDTVSGYCGDTGQTPGLPEVEETGPSLLLLETAGPKATSPGTPSKPPVTPPSTKPPVTPTQPGTPTKPGGTTPAAKTEEPKEATNWLVPAAIAAVVLGGLYWYTSRPPRASGAP